MLNTLEKIMNSHVQSNIISQMNTESSANTDKKAPVPVTGKQVIFIFLTAVAVITICSKSSPLYPFNDWVDANCFLTVGRSMLHGFVPYLDLYEQKGPLLYMIHAFASLISEDSFINSKQNTPSIIPAWVGMNASTNH